MEFICFGSGSSGNSYYVRENEDALLIDLGIGIRTFKKNMRNYGLSLSQIKGILVSHDHTDHIKAVGALSTDLKLPVYAHKDVHMGMDRNFCMTKKVLEDNKQFFNPNETRNIGCFKITSFEVPHDSSANNGYFIESPTTNLCFITDAGKITDIMKIYMAQARNMVVEANYDTQLLACSPYPERLRKRISSGIGHSSNQETAQALIETVTEKTAYVFLCHLSEENNQPELVKKSMDQALSNIPHHPEIVVLPRKVPSGIYNL